MYASTNSSKLVRLLFKHSILFSVSFYGYILPPHLTWYSERCVIGKKKKKIDFLFASIFDIILVML